MNGKHIPVPNVGVVFVCEECLNGTHVSYGHDHRLGPDDRCGCKNLSDDGQYQCSCNPAWPELTQILTISVP